MEYGVRNSPRPHDPDGSCRLDRRHAQPPSGGVASGKAPRIQLKFLTARSPTKKPFLSKYGIPRCAVASETPSRELNRTVHGIDVAGSEVDEETRCLHYHGVHDIIAIRFKCCQAWYPCFECHTELAGHAAERWAKDDSEVVAVLCGSCGKQLTVREYLECRSACPRCRHDFNPGCREDHHLYFEQAGE